MYTEKVHPREQVQKTITGSRTLKKDISNDHLRAVYSNDERLI